MAKPISVQVQQTGFEQSIQAGAKAAGQINIPVNATFNAASFNNLAQPLGRVTGLATEFEKSIAASNARVIAFGASVGIINGIQNAFATLVTTTIEVQKNLALIGAISNKSGQELEKFGDNLFQIAKNTGQSFKIAAEAATEFARQGLTVEETLRRTTDALTLTRFTSLSAADSVDVLTAAVNSFSSAGITTSDILNKLVAVDTKFAVSAADLANGLSRAGSIAQEVGVSLDDLNGIITSVQESTARGGSVIGNAFKTIFTNIRSENTIKALQEIGIYSTEASGKLKPVVPILQELATKLNDLSETKRIEVLESIASKYNINVLSALLNDINKAEGAFQQSRGTSAGATVEAYQRQLELNKSLSVALNNVYVSSEKLANSIGRIGVTENLKGLLDFFGSLITSINDVVDSEGIGGKIAKGLISGLGGIFFKVGIPVLTGLFVILTKNIIQFGAESLQTILGLNSKVKERQALEQAVFNTLVQNEGIMANIVSLAGDRVKQEQFLLDVYNQQLAAIQKVRETAAIVAPGLQAAGLSATTGQITKRSAGGYLPAQEAADVRRGVGGASSSSKVVSIPNFAFGGGKTGTMIANTSEYVVPNFANGGSAIFNQDMISSFGLPAGAKKLSAAGGYIPNFAKYIYDSDRIPADKNATLKAILASTAKKNLIIGPAGSGKSTMAAGMGTFLTGAADVANATEIDILSAAGRTKDGGLSKNLESIMAAVNSTGGKVSYLYTKNFDILSRRGGRTDPSEGDLRSKKQIAGTAYAPLNQYDFMSMVKSKAQSFDMIKAAKGFIPNFAQAKKGYIYEGAGAPPEGRARVITSLGAGFRGVNSEEKLIAAKYRLMDNTELSKYSSSKSQRKTASSNDIAAMLVPNTSLQYSSAEPKDPENQTYASVEFPIYKLSEQGLKNQTSNLGKKPEFFEALREQVDGLGIQLSSQLTGQPVSKDVYDKAFAKSLGAKAALDGLAGGLFETSVRALTFPESIREKGDNTLDFPDLGSKAGQILKSVFNIRGERAADLKGSDSGSIQRKFASQVLKNGLTRDTELPKFKASGGYIPNFAADPLKDAVQREMEAGLDPAQIRITKDARLKNPQNPSGLAVINTRDEPDGKIPNFAAGDAKLDLPRLSGESKSEAADVRKVLNEQAAKIIKANATLEEYDKAVKTVLEKLKQNAVAQEEVKKATDAQRSQIQSIVKSAPAAGGATGGSAGGKSGPADKKEFDIGKFLIFQTALVGATGAIQSFTKEGSNASMALEAGAGLANVAGTAMMVLKSGMGPIGIALTIATTALTALGPVFLKFSASLETESDRVRKSLADLADQAKKTGQEVTPEAFLAALSKGRQEAKAKESEASLSTAIEKAIPQGTQGLGSEDMKALISVIQASGGAVRDKEGKFDQEKINNIVKKARITQKDFTGAAYGGGVQEKSTISVDEAIANEQAAIKARALARRGSVAQKEGITDVEKEQQTYDVQQLEFRQKILQGIFSQELEISNNAAKTALVRERELSGLDKMKGRITELAAIEKERQIELRKITDEQEKFNSLQVISLKKGLGAGVKDSVLSQEALSKASPEKIQGLLSAFGKSAEQEDPSIFKETLNTFLQESGALTAGSTIDSSALEKITENLRAVYEASITQEVNTANQTAAVNQKFDIARTNTTVGKLDRTTKDLQERLNGAGNYADLLAAAQKELTNSLLETKVKNKILIDSAEQNADTQLGLALSNEATQTEIYKRVSIEKDAAIDASKLRQATEEKVRQFAKDSENIGLKFSTDEDLLNAESDYLNNLYSQVSVGEEAIQEGKKLAIQSKKNRRQAEVTATNQKQLFDEDVKQIADKILIAKGFQKQVTQLDLNDKASKELELESLNLARASGELAAQYNNLAAVTANEQTKISNQQAGEITSAIAKGGAYSGTSTNLREQARASILQQNLGGRNPTDVSIEEQANLLSGKANTIGQNLRIEGSGLLDEAKTFQQILGQDTPKALADGLAEAMKVGLSGADNIGEALQNIAKSFLQTLQTAFLQSASNKIVGSTLAAIGGSEGGYVKKFANGGMVTGGSGIRDDVPAMLSAGEYVMRKSAVQKYGAENIAKMNDGGIFLPGVRGGSAISGYDQLSKFANQTTTSGATDVLKGTGSTAFANLEDQSARLSRFGLMNEDTIKGEVTSAQQQGLDLISKREAYRTQQRKAMQQQIISTVASIALAYGASKIPTKKSAPFTRTTSQLGRTEVAYGGMIRGFANGGGPTDDIPALLMGGEYVMNRATTRKYGKQYLDSMNTGRARFADGGEVGMGATVESSDSKAKVDSKTGTAVNISINVSGSGSSTESQGQTSQGGVDYKKMGERIKAVVLETINEEKRLGGALRSR
jgi:TP901 family phage tail tape measure protein